MGKKCKRKIVWKQLNLGENSLPAQNTDGFSYSDAVNNCNQNGYESNWSNSHYHDHVDDKSQYNGGDNGSYNNNNRRQTYRHNRSNRNNAYKWRRRVDRPIEESEKENFTEDGAQLIEDEEEYTKIQTPRQEVIFKKRSLQRRKDVEHECTHSNDIAFEERAYDSNMTEIMHSSISYDDSGMYMPEVGDPALAGLVVQQVCPGGPMISIPCRYGQFVNPTLIPGDPTLLTLDPSYTRIITADEMEDAGIMLPIPYDSNGHPITVQVKVDMNGVPIEIEPHGFQVFQGHIEEKQYYYCSQSEQQPHMEEGFYDEIQCAGPEQEIYDTPTDEERETCGTPSDEDGEVCGTPIDEAAEVIDTLSNEEYAPASDRHAVQAMETTIEGVADSATAIVVVESFNTHSEEEVDAALHAVKVYDISTDHKTTDISIDQKKEEALNMHTNEIEVKQLKEDKEMKENEDCSSDSQYATMSESSSPNTPASELSDHSDIPDQSLKPKLNEQRCSSVKRCENFSQKSAKMEKVSVPKQQSGSHIATVPNSGDKTPSDIPPAQAKRRTTEKKKANISKEVELPNMTWKQRKKEAKLLKKQTKTEGTPTTPQVMIREKASPSLLEFNSTNCGNHFATKSLRSSLALLNSPEFSVQQYLKYQGSFQNRCKASLMNRIDSSNMMISPLEGFGHIDLASISSISDDAVQCQLSKESLPDTPKLKLPTKPNTLRMPQEALADLEEPSLITSEHCTNQLLDNDTSELNVQSNSISTDLISTGIIDEIPDISDLPAEKPKDELLSDNMDHDESTLAEQIEVLSSDHSLLATTEHDSLEINDAESQVSVPITEDEAKSDPESLTNITSGNDQAKIQTAVVPKSESNLPCVDDVTTSISNNLLDSNAHSDNTNDKDCENRLDGQQTINVNGVEVSDDLNHSSDTSPGIGEMQDMYDTEQANLQDKNQERYLNEAESISEKQEIDDGTFSKQGYVMVPVLTPYYSPTVFYGYPLLMQDVCEDQGKFNRKKKRRYKKKYHDNQQPPFYDANQLTGNPYITTDDGFFIPVDPSQACHIHSCQYVQPPFTQQGIIDEGFVSAEATPYLPNYIPEPNVVTPESEVFGNLQTHERKEIAEVLKDAPKSDAAVAESGDSGLSESDDSSKKEAEPEKEIVTDDKSKRQPKSVAKSKAKKENKSNPQKGKANDKGTKKSKHIMVIEEPDFSLPNAYPFSSTSSVLDLDKISIKNGKSKKNKKPKKGKNKKDNISKSEVCEEVEQEVCKSEICESISQTKESAIINGITNSNEVSQIKSNTVITIEPKVENPVDVDILGVPINDGHIISENDKNGNVSDDNAYSTSSDSEITNSTLEEDSQHNLRMEEHISIQIGDTYVEPMPTKDINEIDNSVDAKYLSSQNCEDCRQNFINVVGSGCSEEHLQFIDGKEVNIGKVLHMSTTFPDYSFDQLKPVDETTCETVADLNKVAKEYNISVPLEMFSLAVHDETSDTLSTIEESNEECSEIQINFDGSKNCTESITSPAANFSTKKDILSDSNDSPVCSDNDHSAINENSSHEDETIQTKVSDSGSKIVTIKQSTASIVMKELEETNANIVIRKELEVEIESKISKEIDSVVNDDTVLDRHKNGSMTTDFLPNTNSLENNLVDCDPHMDELLPADQFNGDFQMNNQEVGQICQSLGVTKAVEKWIQEITPAKAFITCNNESQNMLLLNELKQCENNLCVDDNKPNPIEQDSKNGQSNPLAASCSSLNDSDGVARSPRETNDSVFSRRSTLTDLDWNETVPELNKYDPSMFSKYYYLGANVDTPVSSRASSRDPSSNCSAEVPSRSLSANEVDFQDNFYHSNKTDDSISSVPPCENVSRLYTQTSCSDMAISTELQDRKGSCSKETECASLFSSGIGSSLASTPLTSPSHLPPVPTVGGNVSFPHTKQTDPQCAIL